MKIVRTNLISKGFLKLKKHTVKYDGYKFEREFVDIGETVCALVHNIETDKFVFVKQFRPGVSGSYLIELPGGLMDKNKTPVQLINEEVVEETGYKPDSIELMLTTHFVPGYSSEKINIYYVKVSEKISKGGGLEKDDEFIDVVELSRKEIRDLKVCEDFDAKTIMALSMANLINTSFYIYNHNIMNNPDERFGGC